MLKNITLEDIGVKDFFVLMLISSVILICGAFLSSFIYEDNYTVIGIYGEVFRLLLTYISFRFYGYISSPNVSMAVSEILIFTALHYFLFYPGYYASIGYDSFVALWNVACLAMFSMMCAMIYLWFFLKGDNFFWSVILFALAKSSLLKINDLLWSYDLNIYVDIMLRALTIIVIFLMFFLFYRRNKSLISEKRLESSLTLKG